MRKTLIAAAILSLTAVSAFASAAGNTTVSVSTNASNSVLSRPVSVPSKPSQPPSLPSRPSIPSPRR